MGENDPLIVNGVRSDAPSAPPPYREWRTRTVCYIGPIILGFVLLGVAIGLGAHAELDIEPLLRRNWNEEICRVRWSYVSPLTCTDVCYLECSFCSPNQCTVETLPFDKWWTREEATKQGNTTYTRGAPIACWDNKKMGKLTHDWYDYYWNITDGIRFHYAGLWTGFAAFIIVAIYMFCQSRQQESYLE